MGLGCDILKTGISFYLLSVTDENAERLGIEAYGEEYTSSRFSILGLGSVTQVIRQTAKRSEKPDWHCILSHRNRLPGVLQDLGSISQAQYAMYGIIIIICGA